MRLLKRLGAVLLAASSGSVDAAALAALSNDGRYVAYEHREALWLVKSSGGEPSKIDDVMRGHSLPRWSPAGDRLSFYSKKSGTLQLWVYELASGRSRQLTSIEQGMNPPAGSYLGGFGNDPLRYSWSPDGQKIVYATQVAAQSADPRATAPVFPTSQQLAAGQPIVLTPTTPVSWMLEGAVSYGNVAASHYTDKNADTRRSGRPPDVMTNQLFVLDVASGKSTQLTHDAMGYFTPVWSPDGKRIAFMSGEGINPDRNSLETNIFTLDLASGTHRKVSSGRMQKSIPLWSPDGRRLAWRSFIVLGLTRREEGIYVAQADGDGSARNVSRALDDRGQLTFDWSADGKHLLVAIFDGLFVPLVTIDIESGAVESITPTGATVGHGGAMFAASQAGVAWLELREPNGPETLWLDDFTSPPRRVTQVEPAADPQHAPRIDVLHWKNSRGEVIDGLLSYPAHYTAGQAYPMVVDAYSHARLSNAHGAYTRYNMARASKDYFFFQPNHRAPHMWMNHTKTARYDAAAVGASGLRIMTDDILSGVGELVSRGLVNPKKLCVVGFSNGGQQGLQLLTQTDRFRCAVIQSPSTANWLNYVLLEYPEDAIRSMHGVTPWEDPSLYLALSAVFHADKIRASVLLAAGDLEPQVFESVQMFSALRYLKRDVTLLRYTTQGHGFSGEAEEDFTRRATAFLAQHLGAPP